MAPPHVNPWNSSPSLENMSHIARTHNVGTPVGTGRPTPILPPRPMSSGLNYNFSMPSSMPYSYSNYNSPYGSYGGFGTPYRSSLYGTGSYGGYNNYPFSYQSFSQDDHERRFIQYAEESSRHTFASVESVVRAFNSLAMMLDNTFFAMTSSFRAVLGVAENFGRLRTMFGHIWYSVNIFRFISWLYRRFRQMLGLKVSNSPSSLAWKEATNGAGKAGGAPPGSSWPTLAFLGVIISAPYIISKFLPKYEDKHIPANWKAPGIKAKACFDFIASSPNELTIHTNDDIMLAPTYIQEEMNLKNSGWAYAIHNGRSGVIPLNYIVISKKGTHPIKNGTNLKDVATVAASPVKSHTKRVSFGDIEIFESDDVPVRKETIQSEG